MAAKTTWTQLATGGGIACSATNLPGDLMATGGNTSTGPCIQIWEPATVGEWDLRSQVMIPELPLQMAWAHPESGLLLAVASKGSVRVLEAPRPTVPLLNQGGSGDVDEDEEDPLEEREWRVASTLSVSTSAAIKQVSFAPRQYGLLLSVCCADGLIMIWEADRPLAPNAWCLTAKFKAGAMSVSHHGRSPPLLDAWCGGMAWRSYTAGLAPLVAVGVAHAVEIWQYTSQLMTWQRVSSLPLSDPDARCSSVHWAPNMGQPVDVVAASHGRVMDVWSMQGDTSAPTIETLASLQHDAPVWKVEFNMLGSCLAAATENNSLYLYKPNLVGAWQLLSVMQGAPDVVDGDGATQGGMDDNDNDS